MTIPVPKHSWNFAKTSGTVAREPYGGATIALDRPSFVPGRQGQAIRINPKNGACLVTTNVRELSPPWTIAAWVMREEDSEAATLCSSHSHMVRLEQWPNLHQVGVTHAGALDASFGHAIPVHQWVHLALVGTPAGVTLYMNGKRRGDIAAPTVLGLRWLGSTGGWKELASMIIDELTIFDQALTDDQVNELANQSTKLPPPDTIFPLEGQWRCTWNGTKHWTFGIKVSGHMLTLDYSDYWPGKIVSGAILSPDKICNLNPSGPADCGTLTANPDTIHWLSHDGAPLMAWTRAQ